MSDGMLDGATQIELSQEEVEAARAEEALLKEVNKLATVLHAREYEYGEVCPRGGSTWSSYLKKKTAEFLLALVSLCAHPPISFRARVVACLRLNA